MGTLFSGIQGLLSDLCPSGTPILLIFHFRSKRCFPSRAPAAMIIIRLMDAAGLLTRRRVRSYPVRDTSPALIQRLTRLTRQIHHSSRPSTLPLPVSRVAGVKRLQLTCTPIV